VGELAITGASGFVGRSLVNHLLTARENPVVISRQDPGIVGIQSLLVKDYTSTAHLASHLAGVDALIHLAARAHKDVTGTADNALFHAANVVTALDVARACISARVKRLVFVSSIGVNGSCSARPFLDCDTPAPTEPYAISKWNAEKALANLLAGSPTELVIIRPPLVYGPDCPGNFSKLIQFVAKSRWIPLGSLNAPRSFIHVDNLSNALITAARHPGLGGLTFLVADGRDLTVGEVVRTLAASLQVTKGKVINVPVSLLKVGASLLGRKADFDKLAAPLQIDASRFSTMTGWRPATLPEEGLRNTAKGFKQ